MHGRMRSGEIEKPGFYALCMGPMTAMGFLVLNLVFGFQFGTLYDAFAG